MTPGVSRCVFTTLVFGKLFWADSDAISRASLSFSGRIRRRDALATGHTLLGAARDPHPGRSGRVRRRTASRDPATKARLNQTPVNAPLLCRHGAGVERRRLRRDPPSQPKERPSDLPLSRPASRPMQRSGAYQARGTAPGLDPRDPEVAPEGRNPRRPAGEAGRGRGGAEEPARRAPEAAPSEAQTGEARLAPETSSSHRSSTPVRPGAGRPPRS